MVGRVFRTVSMAIIGTLAIFGCRKVYPPQPGPGGAICPQSHTHWPSLAQSPWPMYRHDPQFTGRSPLKGPRKGRLKWSLRPGGTVYCAVVVGPDSTIYFPLVDWQNHRRFLVAVRPDGQLKWKVPLWFYSEMPAPVVLADGSVLVAGSGDTLYVVDPRGFVSARITFGFPLSPLLTLGRDGTIYFTRDTHLYAVRLDGTVLWTAEATHGFFLQHVAISPDGASLYLFNIGPRNADLAALVAMNADGSPKWRFALSPGQGGSFEPPAVDSQGNIWFGTNGISDSCGLYAVDPNGQQLWKYAQQCFGGECIAQTGLVLYRSKEGVVALDCEGRLQWQSPGVANYSPPVVDAEGVSYWCRPEEVVAVAPDGRILWHLPLEAGATRMGSPAIGYDGVLYLGTFGSPLNESRLYAIE